MRRDEREPNEPEKNHTSTCSLCRSYLNLVIPIPLHPDHRLPSMALRPLPHQSDDTRTSAPNTHQARNRTTTHPNQMTHPTPVQITPQHHLQLLPIEQRANLRSPRIHHRTRIQPGRALLQMAQQALLERRLGARHEQGGAQVLDEQRQRRHRGDVVPRHERLVVDHGDLQGEPDAHAREQLEADPRARRGRRVHRVDARGARRGEQRADEQEGLVVAPPRQRAVGEGREDGDGEDEGNEPHAALRRRRRVHALELHRQRVLQGEEQPRDEEAEQEVEHDVYFPEEVRVHHGLVAQHVLVVHEGGEGQRAADEAADDGGGPPRLRPRVVHAEHEARQERGHEDAAAEIEPREAVAQLHVARDDGRAEREGHDGRGEAANRKADPGGKLEVGT